MTHYHPPDALAGGVELGGVVGDVLTTTDAPAGGVELGGVVGDVAHFTDALAGGVELGGVVGDVFRPPDAPAGGVELGGVVGNVAHFTDALAGGVELGGVVGNVAHFTDALAGGVELGGVVGDVFRPPDALAGGVELGGVVGDVWTPPTPVPGATCAAAGVMTLGSPVTVPTTGGGSLLWLTFPVVSGTLYHVRASAMVNVTQVNVTNTGVCPLPTTAFVLFASGCNTFTATGNGFAFVEIQPDFFSAGTVTIVADVGAC